MNTHHELPTRKPNTRLSITDYFTPALNILHVLLNEHKARLRKINKPEEDAWVLRSTWKEEMSYRLRCSRDFAEAIETAMVADGVIELVGSNSYVQRVQKTRQAGE